jgi:glycolate oxidase FAD binding subunit
MATPGAIDDALAAFAAEVGPEGAVSVRGGDTRRHTGGDVAPGTREVRAPAGIVALEPAEMTVRVRAGTTVAELHDALARSGQRTALPERPGGTVGGALMVGESAVTRLGRGPVRDALLQARYVCADGRVASGGAATVKNVSGFDLPRLLVGSLGTIGLLGEVLLRTLPIPESEQWFRLDRADPREVWRHCRTASSILWNGATTWVFLSGYAPDTADDRATLGGLGDVAGAGGPPPLPEHRWSCTPAEAAAFGADRLDAANGTGTGHDFVAEIGVGVVHASVPQPPRPVEPGVAELNRRVKERFDPTGRLNPGRDPLRRS